MGEKDSGPAGIQWGLTEHSGMHLTFITHIFVLSPLDPRHLCSPTIPNSIPNSQRKIAKGMRMSVVKTAALTALRCA